jgi:APA family basic amino acid/polyamine antiporter
MFLAVVPLQEIATAPADRIGVGFTIYFGAIGTLIIADYDFNFACNNGLIMTGARVYYTMAQDGVFFKKAAELNKFSVPEWSIWAQCFGLRFYVLRVNMVIYWICVIIVLIFYILILGIFILRKKMPDAERPELLVIRFTCILHSCCYCNLYSLAVYQN